MASRSSHRYKAVRSGVKAVRVCISRPLPNGTILRVYGIVYRQLLRSIERFETWRARGLNS